MDFGGTLDLMARVTGPAVVVRAAKDGTPFFEAKWRDADGAQVKRRLGPAWLQSDGSGGWSRRRGRVRDGWLDERAAHVAAAEKVEEVEEVAREREAIVAAAARAAIPTFRELAAEWLAWKRDVKGGAPSTLEHNAVMLREPGTPHRRGRRVAKGRIIARFGDRPYDEITPVEVTAFLRDLDAEGLTARNVNEHRALLHAVFAYATKPDTYALATNPAAGTDKRYQPAPEPLDHYEAVEVEALARACEVGEHRASVPNYRGRPNAIGEDEVEARRAEDHQDAELFRVMFYSGMRLGEVLALRWRYVHFLPDLSGAVLDIERAVSGGVEKEPKGRRGRQVPLPRAGSQALARLGRRGDFSDPDDYVFCNRYGGRLDGSALRRRYKRAAAAAGLRPLRLHGLRHAAGSVMARSLPLVTVRDVLGHAELRTTNRYLHSKIDTAAIVAVNAAFGEESVRRV